MSNARDAAGDVLADMGISTEAETVAIPLASSEAPVAQAEATPEPAPEAESQPVVEEPEMPDDLKALLDEPDFGEDDDEPEPVAVAQAEPEQYEDDDVYEDPEKAKLKKQLAAAQKRLAWQEEQRLIRDRASWEKEAKKYLPHSEPFLSNIKATSKRGFLREARDYHEAVKNHISKVGQADVEAAKAEAKAEAQQAWGKATTGPGTTPLDVNQAQAEWEDARQKLDLLGQIKARGFHKLVD